MSKFKPLDNSESPLKDFYSLETPRDGSCLLHAVFFATNPRYRAKSRESRREYVSKFRKAMGELLPSFWNKTNLKELANQLPQEFSVSRMQENFYSTRNLDEFGVWYLSTILEVNIIIIDSTTKKIYSRGPGTFNQTYQSTVLVYYIQNHFETIVYYSSEEDCYYLTFDNTSKILQKLQS